jgi:hypothetical protein
MPPRTTDPIAAATVDATRWFNENTIHAARDYLHAARSGVSTLPDEALINAMGSTWVMKQATGQGLGDFTADAWERYGLPWCCAYNDAYLAALEELLKEHV